VRDAVRLPLTHIAEQTSPAKVERDGSGLCCEVYPDPAIRHWTDGTPERLAKRERYKGGERGAKRGALLAALQAQLTLKDPGGLLECVVLEDDYLDALVCALVARAVERELTPLARDGSRSRQCASRRLDPPPREPS